MHIVFWLLLSLFLARGDDGIGIDPHGRRFNARGDYGCGIDPNGGRCVGGLGDEGSGTDPHGGRVRGQSGLRIDGNG